MNHQVKTVVAQGDSRLQTIPPLVTGIILAGGKSRRMAGVNKALLKIGPNRMIERVCDAILRVLSEAIIITNSPDDFAFLGLPMFGDVFPNAGSLGGLYTGLKHCQGQFGFLVACDMPFLNSQIIDSMIHLIDDYDVVIPRVNARLEPLHAIYSKKCLPFIEDLLLRGNLRILDLFDEVRVREVPEDFLSDLDPEFRFIMNVNNPTDLRQATKLCQAEKGPKRVAGDTGSA